MTLQKDDTYRYIPSTVPLFLLPDHVLLPDLPTPYLVFEPRYKQLIRDLLELPEEERWIGVPRLASGWREDHEGSPSFEPVATVGLLTKATLRDDGKYDIVIRGQMRAWLEEEPSRNLYRMARVEPWIDIDGGEWLTDTSRYVTVLQLVSSLSPFLGETAMEMANLVQSASDRSDGVYRLASIVVQDTKRRQQLLISRRLDERLGIVEEVLSEALAMALGATWSTELPS